MGCRVALSEICDINASQYSTKEAWPRIQYLDTGNVTRGVISELQQLDPLIDKVPSRARRKVKPNSIVYSMVRPNQGHYALLKNPPVDMLVSTGFSVIDADESQVLPSYLYYALTTKGATEGFQTLAEQSVSTYPTLSSADLLAFEVALPPLKCQQQIAAVLERIDEKIAVNAKLNGYLLELAMARFESELETESKAVRFGDVVALEDSKRVPLNSRDREARKGPYPYYGATSVMDHVDDYLFDGVRVLLGEDGTVVDSEGKPILQYVWGKYWVNNHAHILAPSGEYSLEAIYIALSRTTINHIVTGAVQMKISQRNLKSLELEMPSPESLDYLQDLFAVYRSNQDESAKLSSLRDALLPKLMSGEIDVSKVDLTQLNSHLV